MLRYFIFVFLAFSVGVHARVCVYMLSLYETVHNSTSYKTLSCAKKSFT